MNEDERIGQLLVRDGVITEDDLNRALEAQRESYEKKALGEIMIGLDIISEAEFLRVLAKKFNTQYLTTEKLSKLKVAEMTLKLVPENTADKYVLFPVKYKRNESSLIVVMADPDDVGAVDELKFVSGIANIQTLVGLKDSIKAAISRWYKGEERAFDLVMGVEDANIGYELPGSTAPPAQSLENDDGPLDFEGLLTEGEEEEEGVAAREEIISDGEDQVYLGGMDEMPGDINQARDQIVVEDLGEQEETPEEMIEITVSPVSKPEPEPEAEPEPDKERVEDVEAKPVRRPDAKKLRLRMLVVEEHPKARDFFKRLFTHEGFSVIGAENKEEALIELSKAEYDSLVIKDKELGEGEELANMIAERFPGVEICSIKNYGSAVIGETRAKNRLMAAFLETLDIVIGLLEMESGGMQGHSHNASKYARLIASKLDLAQRDVDTIALAAYIHDLGKKGVLHRTVLESGSDTDVDELMEQAEIPLRLLSAAKFPLDIANIIKHQYEKWDGSGVPGRLKGEDIPIGARVLALVEAFEHLTNKYSDREAVDPSSALEILQAQAGVLFDPALVDLLLGVVKDDMYIQQMAGARERILIVDHEVDFATLLELRLINDSFDAKMARTAEDAIEMAKVETPSLIIAEVELPDMSGFEMIEKIKEIPETNDVPFVFLSRNDDSASVDKSFKLGAQDFIPKPIKVDILGAKVNTMMKRLKAQQKAAPAAAGVSGQLSEMDIPAIVQILGAGRKTGRITLENKGETAVIEMEEGRLVNAIIDDLKGEEAFYKILYWEEGSFTIDPTAEVTERLINMSIDSLMLEGYRRMDEEGKGGGSEEDIALDGSDIF
jgi:response regulator RpfG family c-di-GMP phosphodiesterase